MACKWMDGFEINDWATILTAGYTVVSTAVMTIISSTSHKDSGGRGGTYCVNINPASTTAQGFATPALVSPYSAAGAFRINNSSASTTIGFFVEFRLSGNTQARVLFRTDGFIEIFRNTGTSLFVSAGTYTVGIWNWFSIEADIDNAGSITVFLNGVSVATFSGDTQQQASPGFDQVVIGAVGSASIDIDFDDFTIDDTLTEIPETYWVLQAASGNGTPLEFTPSAGTNWENVEENPPSSAEYNETATAGDQDMYSYPNLPFSPASIYAVATVLYAARDGSITGFAAEINSGGTPDTGPTVSPAAAGVYTLSYSFFDTDPDTAAAWTESAVNALEAGISAV